MYLGSNIPQPILGSLSTLGPTPSLQVPPRLLPLAVRLQTWASTNSRRWRSQAELEVEKCVASDGYDAWPIIVHDGHLFLIQDVLLYAERLSLDFTTVFETLETIVGTFSITRSIASASACSRLKEVQADARECLYGSSELGSREGSNVSVMPD